MKNLKKYSRYSLYLLLAVVLYSCGNEQPLLNSDSPFVVTKIKEYNDTHAGYYSKQGGKTGNNIFGSWQARIVLPKGYYSVGDTITFEKPKHYR